MRRPRGVNSFAERSRPCRRCGNWHTRSMVKSYVCEDCNQRFYVAAHIPNPVPYRWGRDAELDQCDAWAAELDTALRAIYGTD